MLVSPSRWSRHAHAAVVLSSALALLSAGCGDVEPAAEPGRPGTVATARAASTAVAVASTPTGGTGAHDRHAAVGVACETCHPCGGALGFATVQYPGGTTTEGGQVTQTANGASCSVGCHSPLGAPATQVGWNDGPLHCTDCHGNVIPADAASVRSTHFVGMDPGAVECASCHDNSSHTSGTVVLVGVEGTEGACVACHDGDGGTIGGATPPLLVGWTDTVRGDFHGSRAGTGYGGEVKAPYARQQPPLDCGACHDAHASPNAFLFAPRVNGVAIPAATIGRAGVGAEALCNACHQGDRHAPCKACHTAVKVDLGDGHVWFDSSAPPVDPAPPGYPCFWCHGHEGIVRWTQPGSLSDDMTRPWNESCVHCHSFRGPLVETVAPAITSSGPVTVAALSSTSATITWTTNEDATSYVEYGVTTATHVAGDAALAKVHGVTLSGLVSATTYVYRVRSSDQYRNVLRSPLRTFTTPNANAPAAPTLLDTPGQSGPEDALTFTMRWNPVTAPDGDPVQYRMVLAEDPSFAVVVIDTGWTTATSHTAALSTHSPQGSYWWRVMARDAVHDIASPWSTVDTFYAWDDRDE